MSLVKEPVFEDGKWWIEKDPDDQYFYTANVAPDLAIMGTTASSCVLVVQGVEKLSEPTISAGLITAKLGGLGPEGTDSFCTYRTTCANGERFDRTIWFRRVSN